MSQRATTSLVASTMIATAVVLTGFALALSGEANPSRTYHVVDVRQLRFEPAALTVAPGDTVVWINRDIVPHTVTALNADWGSGGLEKDATWQQVVTIDETVQYYCKYHPTMRGTIVVKGD